MAFVCLHALSAVVTVTVIRKICARVWTVSFSNRSRGNSAFQNVLTGVSTAIARRRKRAPATKDSPCQRMATVSPCAAKAVKTETAFDRRFANVTKDSRKSTEYALRFAQEVARTAYVLLLRCANALELVGL